jgi:hypothetical protein
VDTSDGVDVLFWDTVLRYYLSIEPNEMPDEVWAQTIKNLNEIRKLENNG